MQKYKDMNYTNTQIEDYISSIWGNEYEGYDDDYLREKFEELIVAVLNNPVVAHEQLVNEIKHLQ